MADIAERKQQASNAARQVKDRFAAPWQPLLVAAIGMAVGAAIAAALRKSRLEDKFIGEASDVVKETIGEVAAGQYETAKEMAGAVAQWQWSTWGKRYRLIDLARRVHLVFLVRSQFRELQTRPTVHSGRRSVS